MKITYDMPIWSRPAPDRPLEPPGLWREEEDTPRDTDEMRREFIKDNPAMLLEYLEGYDKTLIDDFIDMNSIDYRRWLYY